MKIWNIAFNWWSSLSINEQKQFSKKHLIYSYQYEYIWNYSYAKYVSKILHRKLIIQIWSKQNLFLK
jgi:hypothetical protein